MFVAHRLFPMLLLLLATAPIGHAADASEPDPLDGLRALIKQGKPAEAETGAGDLLATVESEHGADSAEAAAVLDVWVEARWRGGKAQEPETLDRATRALAIKRSSLGPRHAGVGETLHQLGVVSFFRGKYGPAREYWEEAISIRREALGPDHPDLATSLNGLANLLTTVGDYAAARSSYTDVVKIREKAFGPDHPAVAQPLNNLSILLGTTGEYVEALEVGRRSLEIKEATLGPEHPQLASSLTNLADVLFETGDFEGAREMLERALGIWEGALGAEHPFVGAAVNNLAEQLRNSEKYDEARPLYERAISIWEAAYGVEHPRVAIALNNLADLHDATGDPVQARALHERAAAIREGLGANHPELSESLDSLGRLLLRSRDFDGSAPLLERAIAIRKASLGARHPYVAATQIELAKQRAAIGEAGAAVDLALASEEISRDHLRLTGRSLAEQQALRYAASRKSGLDLALTLAGTDGDPSTARRALDSLVRSRGVVLDAMAARNRGVSGAGDPEIDRLASALTDARERLANLTVRGLGDLDPVVYRKLLDQAREEKERAERALAGSSAEFAQEQERSRLGLDEVLVHLPAKSALVSFTVYEQLPVGSADDPTRSYMAVVVDARKRIPAVVDLGPVAEIDPLIAQWKKEAARGAGSIRRTPEEAETVYRDVAAELRAKIWDPLSTGLKNAKRVFVVPDGELNLVSFASLPVGASDYVVTRGPLVHYLSAERDLVPLAGADAATGTGLLALGGPDYDSGKPGRREPVASSTRSSCGDFDSLRFAPLPAAAREVEEVVALWKEASEDSSGLLHLAGAEATEERFKRSARGRKVLHLATHGFFLGGECAAAGGSRGLSISKAPKKAKFSLQGLSPLLLSGLALAGANQRAEVTAGEDGVLTAEEIAALDLSGTEWAVLSACDTGVGEIQAGEGVFGLRRAMQVSGVRTLIMSLWPVDDEATRQWMTALYDLRLNRGRDSARSVRDAARRVLKARRKRGESTHPFYWAAFVAAGDWR